jgi:hypothetical protein
MKEILLPVDSFFEINREGEHTPDLQEPISVDFAISAEEYDDLHGLNEGDFVQGRYRVYQLMINNPEKINITFTCKHGGGEYHHPDYTKPFDVHNLCKRCHVKLSPFNKYIPPSPGSLTAVTPIRSWNVEVPPRTGMSDDNAEGNTVRPFKVPEPSPAKRHLR